MKTEHLSAEQYNKKYGSMFKTFKPKNKYNAVKTEIDNKKFDSQSEGKLYWDLKMQERQGLIQEVICQAKEPLEAYGVHIFNYYVDFKVIHNDGRIEFIEHKATGTVTDLWKAKFKMLEAKYKDDKNVVCSVNWYKSFGSIQQKR